MSGYDQVSSGSMRNYLNKKYNGLLDCILVAEELMSGVHDTNSEVPRLDKSSAKNEKMTNKELIQKIAGSLVNASIEKLRLPREEMVAETELNLPNNYHNDELNNYLNHMDQLQNVNINKPVNEVGEPFLAIFLDKLITRLVPEKLPEREHLLLTEEIGKTIENVKIQTISVATLASNINKLSSKMENVFEFQDSLIRVIRWKKPSKMVTSLIIFTIICYNPMYLILFPLLYLVFSIIVPKYTKKYNLRSVQFHNRKHYGKSLFNTLLENKTSINSFSSYNADNYNQKIMEGNSETSQNNNNQDITHGMQVVINLRDFQNLTTSQLKLIDAISKFVNETAAFKDERTSTILAINLLALIIVLRSVSGAMNWSLTLSATAWIAAIVIHPKMMPRVKRLVRKVDEIKTNKNNKQQDDKYDIILDQQPEARFVEIFEIYREGLIPTTWKFFLYSSSLFDLNDEYRKAQKPPPGVKEINQVLPPENWVFDENSNWELDKDIGSWSQERELNLTVDNDFLVDTTFKRRRLTRRVLRYFS